jgi:hypothetical protein
VKTLILIVILLGISLALFSIRLFFIKDASVRGGCASKNPMLAADNVTCTICGQDTSKNECKG